MTTLSATYTAAPSAWRYMLREFLPSVRRGGEAGFPDLRLHWRGFRVGRGTVAEIARLSGLAAPDDRLQVLAPHVTGFRLLMAALTHPTWPLPITRALQVRNRLRLHRPLRDDERFDLQVAAGGWRVADKGVEVDLGVQLRQGNECVWDSVVTFYYRGRHGVAASHGPAPGAPAEALPLDAAVDAMALGRMSGDGRWRFGALTGDYNPAHQWDRMARRLGFPAAFAHSQRAVARCLAALPAPAAGPQQLDLWIKGPVIYGREIALRHAPLGSGGGADFGLWVAGESRPALLGRWIGLPAGAPEA